jgi:endonuclease-3
LNKQKRTAIFKKLQAANPNPTTELHYSSPFELLVSVVLSAQATDVSVNKATTELFQVANTPETMLKLGLRDLKKKIRIIGLYNAKADNLIKTCKILLENFNGQVPNNRDCLESLPGVGRKTANVILNTAFGQPTIGVDTHIFRVSNRTGIAPGKNVLEVEVRLLKFVPETFRQDAHHWLILHGRYTCMARKPRCVECVIADECEWKDKKMYS